MICSTISDGGITEKNAKDIINYSDVKYAYGNKKVGSYIGNKSYAFIFYKFK